MQGRAWTEDEIEFLKASCRSMTSAEIAQHLGKSPAAVRCQGTRQGLRFKRTPAKTEWSEAELAFLREAVNTMSSKEAARQLGRPLRGVRSKASRMGLKFRLKEHEDGSYRCVWTQGEVTQLLGYSEWCSIEQAAKRLGRSYNSVKTKADALGLSFKQGRLTLTDLSQILGVDVKTVQRRRDKLGLLFRKDKEGGTPQAMRGPKGKDIVAIAQDILNDPPLRGLPNTSARKLREVIQEYEGWE